MREGLLPPRLIQIALSVVDLRETERWLREGFGFVPAGGSRRLMRGPLASRIQGLPRVASTCWWLRDRNDWFQIEMFQFERPIARLMPHDARGCDLGYTRVGFWVADFDATLFRLARIGSQPLSDPIGEPGYRRACVRSPDGVFVEIMEDDPLTSRGGQAPASADCPVAVRSVTLSVADLDQSAAFLSDGLGMPASGAALRRPEHEALWCLPGAATRSQVFDAGDVLVEVVQYLDPAGRPRPDDYRISDQGILNVALGTRSKSQFDDLYRRACAVGARPNSTPLRIPGAAVVYVNDPQQYSFELIRMSRASDKYWGFTPIPITSRPQPDTHAIEQTAHIAAPPDVTWQVISDHEAMSEWAGIGPVRRIVDGETDPDGRGAQRELNIGGKIIEQVISRQPTRFIPLPDHQRITIRVPSGRAVAPAPRQRHRGDLEDPVPSQDSRHRPADRRRTQSRIEPDDDHEAPPACRASRPAGESDRIAEPSGAGIGDEPPHSTARTPLPRQRAVVASPARAEHDTERIGQSANLGHCGGWSMRCERPMSAPT